MQSLDSFRRSYLLGAIVVWTAIILASAVILLGTPYFVQVVPVLAGGAIWFAAIVPAALRRL